MHQRFLFCFLFACGPVGEATLTAADATLPTLQQQQTEQALRATLVRDVSPPGWTRVSDARFAAGKISRDAEVPLISRAPSTSAQLVLADGRRFVRDTARSRGTEARPAYGEGNGDVTLFTEADLAVSPVRSQIGSDNRDVTDWDQYNDYPYRSVGTILWSSNSLDGFCTAALISPRIAITAGHCVYDRDDDTWNWNTWFSPGHRGRGASRFVNGTPRRVVGLMSFTSWVDDGDRDGDVGFLILEDRASTANLGWFGFKTYDNDDLEDLTVHTLQYPGEWEFCADSFDADQDCWAYQYFMSTTVNDSCGSARIEHRADTNPGSSGSPIYRKLSTGRFVAAVHVQGRNNSCDDDDNIGVALTSGKTAVACDLLDDFPSQFASAHCN